MFCHNCGKELKDGARFCPQCGTGIYDPERPTPEPRKVPGENVALGTLGAVVGAVLGGVLLVVCSSMEIYSAFAGFVLAAATIVGYDLLGKRRGAAGTVVVMLLILISPYLADTLDWARVLLEDYEGLGLTLIDGVGLLYLFLAEGRIHMDVYILDTLALYGFTAMGAVAALSWSSRRAKQ